MTVGSVCRRMSLVAVGAALAVSAFGVASSGAATGSPPNATAALPVVKVSPSTGLVDLQKVTVTGSGFSVNVQIGTVECRPGATGEADCDLGTLVYVQSDQHGKFTLSRYVRRLISVGGKTIDCGAAKGCIVGAGNVSNLQQASGQTIFFNPKIPPKVPAITVTPNTKLADHQLITVSGKGYAPSTTVYLSQCITHPGSRAAAVLRLCHAAVSIGRHEWHVLGDELRVGTAPSHVYDEEEHPDIVRLRDEARRMRDSGECFQWRVLDPGDRATDIR